MVWKCVSYFVVCIVMVIGDGFARERFFHGRFLKHRLGSTKEATTTASVDTKWFTQRLDHFDLTNTRTWQQRYYVRSDRFTANGPAFLMLGGEGEASAIWLDDQVTWVGQYGLKRGAIFFQLEHRFYGKSYPTNDMSVENLKYLNSRQALADSADFIMAMRTQYNLFNNKWIVFGGSYSGALAAWMRLKYPHLAFAAVASSAPIRAKVDFSEYLEVVTNSLGGVNSVCVENIRKGIIQVRAEIRTNVTNVSSTFKTCKQINPSNENDISTFLDTIIGNFEGVVQYNKDNRAFEGAKGTNITVETLCKLMSSKGRTQMQQLADVNTLLMSVYEQSCIDTVYADTIAEMKEISWNSSSGARQWFWQTCTEFAYYQTTDSKVQPFGDFANLTYNIQQCADVFGSQYSQSFVEKSVNETNTYYGALNIDSENIVFPNGDIDPWHALGLLKSSHADLHSIFIHGTAHCADMYPPAANDLPQLKKAREQIDQLIDSWLHTSEIRNRGNHKEGVMMPHLMNRMHEPKRIQLA